MRLYTFEVEGKRTIGVEYAGQIVDLPVAYDLLQMKRTPPAGAPRKLPGDMLQFVRMGEPALQAARDVLALMKKRPAAPVGEQLAYPLEVVKILAPIPRPGKILCTGLDDKGKLADNSGAQIPAGHSFFLKLPSSVIGPGAAIRIPRMTRQLEVGVQCAVVIGRRLRNEPAEAVLEGIFGYTILHDVTARDFPTSLGKNFDTFCPLGPCIVTRDELVQPEKCSLRTSVNGKTMQSGNTANAIIPMTELLSFLSRIMTLEPGDVVSTGTPAGLPNPADSVKAGDVILAEVEGIGMLENPVLDEA